MCIRVYVICLVDAYVYRPRQIARFFVYRLMCVFFFVVFCGKRFIIGEIKCSSAKHNTDFATDIKHTALKSVN